MCEQPSTSRTVPSDAVVSEPPIATAMMFIGIPSVPASYQQQVRVPSGTVSTTWLVPISSSGFSSGISYVVTQQIFYLFSVLICKK